MARPIKPRDSQALTRDIQQLMRLRMSIMIDDSLSYDKRADLGATIETLVNALMELSKKRAA